MARHRWGLMVAELKVVQVHFRRETHAFSLSEFPAIIGLFFPRIAIDDFVTGYSSLGYLRRFRVDILKIARDFIGPAEREEEWAFASAIVAIGRSLGVTMVAEGSRSPGSWIGSAPSAANLARGSCSPDRTEPTGSVRCWDQEHRHDQPGRPTGTSFGTPPRRRRPRGERW